MLSDHILIQNVIPCVKYVYLLLNTRYVVKYNPVKMPVLNLSINDAPRKTGSIRIRTVLNIIRMQGSQIWARNTFFLRSSTFYWSRVLHVVYRRGLKKWPQIRSTRPSGSNLGPAPASNAPLLWLIGDAVKSKVMGTLKFYCKQGDTVGFFTTANFRV